MSSFNLKEATYDAYKSIRNTESITISTDEEFVNFENYLVSKVVRIAYDIFHGLQISQESNLSERAVSLRFNTSCRS